MKKLVLLGFLIIVLLMVSGCVDYQDTYPSQQQASKVEELTVSSWTWTYGDYGSRYLSGILKNNVNKQFNYVSVQFNLYNDRDIQVGSTLDNINNLEPYGTWKFKALVLEDEATKAKLVGIQGF